MRYVATAKLGGNRLHEVKKYVGPDSIHEARNKALRKMSESLAGQGYRVPYYYWLQEFSPEEKWRRQPFPK